MTVRQKDTKRDRETRAEKEGHGRDGLNEDRTQECWTLAASLSASALRLKGELWIPCREEAPPKLRESEMSASVMGGV